MATTISFNVKDVVDISLSGNDFLDAMADYLKSVQSINNYFKIDTMNDSSGKYSLYLLPKSNQTSGVDVLKVGISFVFSGTTTTLYINGAGGHASTSTVNYAVTIEKSRINFKFYFNDYGECMVVARDINNFSGVINTVFAETEKGEIEGVTHKNGNSNIYFSYAQNLTGNTSIENLITGYSEKFLIRLFNSYDVFKRLFFAVNNMADVSPYELDGKKYVEFDGDNTKIGVAMLYEWLYWQQNNTLYGVGFCGN